MSLGGPATGFAAYFGIKLNIRAALILLYTFRQVQIIDGALGYRQPNLRLVNGEYLRQGRSRSNKLTQLTVLVADQCIIGGPDNTALQIIPGGIQIRLRCQ